MCFLVCVCVCVFSQKLLGNAALCSQRYFRSCKNEEMKHAVLSVWRERWVEVGMR